MFVAREHVWLRSNICLRKQFSNMPPKKFQGEYFISDDGINCFDHLFWIEGRDNEQRWSRVDSFRLFAVRPFPFHMTLLYQLLSGCLQRLSFSCSCQCLSGMHTHGMKLTSRSALDRHFQKHFQIKSNENSLLRVFESVPWMIHLGWKSEIANNDDLLELVLLQ